jgi:hypothetical protein
LVLADSEYCEKGLAQQAVSNLPGIMGSWVYVQAMGVCTKCGKKIYSQTPYMAERLKHLLQ